MADGAWESCRGPSRRRRGERRGTDPVCGIIGDMKGKLPGQGINDPGFLPPSRPVSAVGG
jgi:hypothetical protein